LVLIKRFKRGIPIIPTHNLLGYTKDDYKRIVIGEDEAEILLFIYSSYIKGMTEREIAEELMKNIIQVKNKNLKETLHHIMDEWEEGKCYKVEGIHIPEDKAFIFELKEYEELPDFRKGKE
jgi:hypothetical protein